MFSFLNFGKKIPKSEPAPRSKIDPKKLNHHFQQKFVADLDAGISEALNSYLIEFAEIKRAAPDKTERKETAFEKVKQEITKLTDSDQSKEKFDELHVKLLQAVYDDYQTLLSQAYTNIKTWPENNTQLLEWLKKVTALFKDAVNISMELLNHFNNISKSILNLSLGDWDTFDQFNAIFDYCDKRIPFIQNAFDLHHIQPHDVSYFLLRIPKEEFKKLKISGKTTEMIKEVKGAAALFGLTFLEGVAAQAISAEIAVIDGTALARRHTLQGGRLSSGPISDRLDKFSERVSERLITASDLTACKSAIPRDWIVRAGTFNATYEHESELQFIFNPVSVPHIDEEKDIVDSKDDKARQYVWFWTFDLKPIHEVLANGIHFYKIGEPENEKGHVPLSPSPIAALRFTLGMGVNLSRLYNSDAGWRMNTFWDQDKAPLQKTMEHLIAPQRVSVPSPR